MIVCVCAGVRGCVCVVRARPFLAAAATCYALASFVALNEFYVHFTSADFCQSDTEAPAPAPAPQAKPNPQLDY